MQLENVVIDANEPQRLGRFWQAALSAETLTDEPDLFEARLSIADGLVLDFCFPRVPEAPTPSPRLHLDLSGEEDQDGVVRRLLGLGARHLDIGQGNVPWVVLADPEGNAFCVIEEGRAAYAGSGPLAALPLHSANPDRDAGFWAWLTGWTDVTGDSPPRCLRHPSLRGPLLELVPERAAKTATKNRVHLDVRLASSEDADATEAEIIERGGARLDRPEWGELPWRSYTDPSGNEFCVLPAHG